MALEDALQQFRAEFRGAVFEPHDATYHEARKVYNAMIDRKPRMIVRCTSAADVLAAIRLARATGWPVSVPAAVGMMQQDWAYVTTRL